MNNDDYIRIFGLIFIVISMFIFMIDFPIKTHKEG